MSVVVPCYGRGDMLRECLESLRTQSFRDWEAIVIDDGTPSSEVKDAVTDLREPRIRYVRHPRNLGLAASRNTGFREANARLILPFDSDDWLRPTFLEKTLEVLCDDPAVDCVYTDYQLFGDTEVVRQHHVGSLEEILQFQWVPGSGTLQRKAIWEGVGGFCEPPLMTDECEWDYWIGACARGLKAVHVAEPLYMYRKHAQTLSAGATLRESAQREAIYRRHKKTIDAFRLGSKFRAAGYLNSAKGYLRNGRRAPAIGLTLRGLRLDPFDAQLWRQLPIALFPPSIVRRIRERHIARAAREA